MGSKIMVEIKDLKKVLKDSNKIIKHHEELSKAKGDHFNLFSILDIETKENKTHSAFLAELLNPKGSHSLGDVFLKHFLTIINASEKIISSKTNVKIEHHIGVVKLNNKKGEDPSKASGGRIDIYLEDTSKNSISIENKIHASDQEAQIQRYCNYKKSNNTVYYLTLKGEDPSEGSRLELEANTDFFNISYKTNIIAWLELCLKEVPNFTALREAINQYILLIKKLTHTLDNKAENELFDTMTDYLDESKFIVDNYQKLVNTIRDKFRNDVKRSLETKLDKATYSLEIGAPIHNSFAQLWINYKGNVDHKFRYGIESFSGKGNAGGKMFVGVFGSESLPKFEFYPELERLNEVWQHIHYLTTTQDNSLNLNSTVLLQRIRDGKEIKKYEVLLETIVNQILVFISKTEKELDFILCEDNSAIEHKLDVLSDVK